MVSALVRSYLTSLVRSRDVDTSSGSSFVESERERRRRLPKEVLEDVRDTRGGFKASDSVSRESLYRGLVRRLGKMRDAIRPILEELRP